MLNSRGLILIYSRHAAAAILRVVYGYDVKATHDFYVSLVDEAVKDLMHVVTGLFLVEFLPILKYIPCKISKC
jgi:hypothetical protein